MRKVAFRLPLLRFGQARVQLCTSYFAHFNYFAMLSFYCQPYVLYIVANPILLEFVFHSFHIFLISLIPVLCLIESSVLDS